jgi:hypothetical protein
VLDEAEADKEEPLTAAGDMPRGKQFGYVFMQHADDPAWTLAHELGHGIFTLQHAFDRNLLGPDSKTKTTNLMDYASGTELGVWQWNTMANPAPLTWFDTDEDAMAVIKNDKATRQIIEALRFSYAFNRPVTIGDSDNKQNSTGANDIILGDLNQYKDVLIVFQTRPITINPKAVELSEDFKLPGETDVLRFGFNPNRQVDYGSYIRSFHDVELVSKIKDDQFENLKKYILCENAESWLRGIDKLLNTGGASLANLSALSNEALSEMTNEQRMKLLNKIIAAELSDYYPLAMRVMSNVPPTQTKDMFARLSNTTIFASLKNLMSHTAYTDFVKSSLHTFYSQDDIKERLLNSSPEKIFVWYRYAELNGSGDDINYSLSLTGNTLRIRGNVTKTILVGPPTMQSPRPGVVGGSNTYNLYDETVNITDLLALRVDTDLGTISGNGKVYPIPAFYFDWLITNYNREQTVKAIDITLTLASLAVGGAELRMAIKVGRFLYASYIASGVAFNTYNLLKLTNANVFNKLRNDERLRFVVDFIDILSSIHDLSNIAVSRIVTKNNVQFFSDFTTAWSLYKDEFNKQVRANEINPLTADEIINEVQNFVDEVNVEISKY